jgi:hypothetical protein
MVDSTGREDVGVTPEREVDGYGIAPMAIT